MKKILTVLLALFLLCACSDAAAEDAMKVTFLSVGAADCIVIETADSTVIVDTAEASSSEKVLSFLKSEGIETVDVLFITHFDQDHVGGAAAVLEALNVEKVYTTYLSSEKDSEEIDAFYAALEEQGKEAEVVSEQFRLTLDGVTYTVYPPENGPYKNDDSNNSSLVITLQYGETSFLLAGDAEKERIKEILEYGIDCDVLKMPHHGRLEKNTDELLDSVAPAYAVITSSEEEPEDSEVLEYLQERNIAAYLTRKGSVTFYSDGKDLQLRQ